MISALFQLITVNIIHGRVTWINNCFSLILILAVVLIIDIIEDRSSNNDDYCRDDTTPNDFPIASRTQSLCFTTKLFLATFLAPDLLRRATSDLFTHLIHQLSHV